MLSCSYMRLGDWCRERPNIQRHRWEIIFDRRSRCCIDLYVQILTSALSKRVKCAPACTRMCITKVIIFVFSARFSIVFVVLRAVSASIQCVQVVFFLFRAWLLFVFICFVVLARRQSGSFVNVIFFSFLCRTHQVNWRELVEQTDRAVQQFAFVLVYAVFKS